jgi:hypothetical protein
MQATTYQVKQDYSGIGGIFKEAGKTLLDAMNPLPVINRYFTPDRQYIEQARELALEGDSVALRKYIHSNHGAVNRHLAIKAAMEAGYSRQELRDNPFYKHNINLGFGTLSVGKTEEGKEAGIHSLSTEFKNKGYAHLAVKGAIAGSVVSSTVANPLSLAYTTGMFYGMKKGGEFIGNKAKASLEKKMNDNPEAFAGQDSEVLSQAYGSTASTSLMAAYLGVAAAGTLLTGDISGFDAALNAGRVGASGVVAANASKIARKIKKGKFAKGDIQGLKTLEDLTLLNMSLGAAQMTSTMMEAFSVNEAHAGESTRHPSLEPAHGTVIVPHNDYVPGFWARWTDHHAKIDMTELELNHKDPQDLSQTVHRNISVTDRDYAANGKVDKITVEIFNSNDGAKVGSVGLSEYKGRDTGFFVADSAQLETNKVDGNLVFRMRDNDVPFFQWPRPDSFKEIDGVKYAEIIANVKHVGFCDPCPAPVATIIEPQPGIDEQPKKTEPGAIIPGKPAAEKDCSPSGKVYWATGISEGRNVPFIGGQDLQQGIYKVDFSTASKDGGLDVILHNTKNGMLLDYAKSNPVVAELRADIDGDGKLDTLLGNFDEKGKAHFKTDFDFSKGNYTVGVFQNIDVDNDCRPDKVYLSSVAKGAPETPVADKPSAPAAEKPLLPSAPVQPFVPSVPPSIEPLAPIIPKFSNLGIQAYITMQSPEGIQTVYDADALRFDFGCGQKPFSQFDQWDKLPEMKMWESMDFPKYSLRFHPHTIILPESQPIFQMRDVTSWDNEAVNSRAELPFEADDRNVHTLGGIIDQDWKPAEKEHVRDRVLLREPNNWFSKLGWKDMKMDYDLGYWDALVRSLDKLPGTGERLEILIHDQNGDGIFDKCDKIVASTMVADSSFEPVYWKNDWANEGEAWIGYPKERMVGGGDGGGDGGDGGGGSGGGAGGGGPGGV